jgi:hypothetical protein
MRVSRKRKNTSPQALRGIISPPPLCAVVRDFEELTRYRKLSAYVWSLYGKLDPQKRQSEIRQDAEMLIREYCE